MHGLSSFRAGSLPLARWPLLYHRVRRAGFVSGLPVALQQRRPVCFLPVQFRVKGLLLAQGTEQARQIGLLPAPRAALCALVEIDQPAALGLIEQDVMDVQVGVVDAGSVKAGDG